MNILIVTFDPPQNVGGIEGRGSNYVKFLKKLGHYVEIISFSPEGDFSKESLHGATQLNFPSSSRRALKAFARTRKEIADNSIDAIFLLSGALTLYGMILLSYTRLKGIRTLILFYGKDILSARESISASIALKISPRLAKKITVNSRYTESLLPKRYAKKIEILYPSVDAAITEVSAKEGGRTVLFVGRLVKRKGVDDLLTAFTTVSKKFPDSKLEIVGDGPELENLEKLAKEAGIDKSVKFFGRLAGKELYERYANCALFVMPSRSTKNDVEGFGTVFLEAGIFAKPSIGTTSGGIPEAIRDNVTGLLVPEGNAELLARAIEKLLSDPELAGKMGQAAKKIVLAEFTWESATEKLASMLM